MNDMIVLDFRLDNFIIGGVDLGKTRITVSKLEPAYENIIILGMNILAWFNMLVSYGERKITLSQRRFKNIDNDTRFSRADIFTKNILASEIEVEDEE